MIMQSKTDFLAKYRQEPIGERAYTILSRPRLFSLALAWTLVNKKLPSEEETDLEKLWGKVEFDFAELQELSGLSPLETIQGFNLLRKSRVILPDGTLNQYARALISGKVKESLDALFPKGSKLQKES